MPTDPPQGEPLDGAADAPGVGRDDERDDEHAAPGAPPRRGVDVAREALAAARLAARSRGDRPGPPEGQRRRRRVPGELRSGARPDDRDPQPLGRAIDRLLAERGWELEAAVGGVMARWDEIVGAEMAAHCRPEAYDDTVVTVRTDSTAWASEVRLLAPQLVRRLNEELGHGTVTRVRVLGPAGPSWRRGPLSVKGRGPRDTYG